MDFEVYLQDLIRQAIKTISISFEAKIVSYDKAKLRATISPQLQISNLDSQGKQKAPTLYPNFTDIPVRLLSGNGFFIRPDFAVGDIVTCIVPAAAPKLFIDDKMKPNQNQRGFDLTNCYIVGTLLPKDFAFPSEFASKSGLLIGKSGQYAQFDGTNINLVNGTKQLQLTNSQLNVMGNLNVTGTIDATGNIKTTADVQSQGGSKSLNNHIHQAGALITGPTPGSPVTGVTGGPA